MAYVDTIAEVAAEYGLTRDDLTGPSRLRRICIPRWEAMRRLRGKGLTTSSIGRLLNRNHATVVHGLRRAG